MPAQSEPYDAPAIVTFALELKAWREAAGLNRKRLADALGFADSYVGQIELRKNLPSEEFAEALDTYFKTNGLFERLRQRIVDTRHLSILPPGFSQYLRYEAKASCLRIFSSTLISGLFQTEDYARTIISTLEGVAAERLVVERMSRRSIFEQENPPRVFFILDEGVIRRVVGNKEMTRVQLEYLLEAGQREKTQLQIVPLNAGYYAGLTGSFTILGFDDGPDIAYTESSGEGILLEQRDRVALQVVTWDLVQGHTLPPRESLAMIEEVVEQL
ncbi:helix-turn-helix domain-containing protein [Spirillospora sp. CA-294931]|uniref:helix-turn-helix domain-containing protein n=1 Tax=Spirillospora sp. CA-294931 TaxID=3240042 RepID=UPI003D8EABE6